MAIFAKLYMMNKLSNISVSDIVATRHERSWTSGALVVSSAAASYYIHCSLSSPSSSPLPPFVRYCIGGAVAAPLLMFPSGMVKGSHDTLMMTSLCGMMAGKVIAGIVESTPSSPPPSPSIKLSPIEEEEEFPPSPSPSSPPPPSSSSSSSSPSSSSSSSSSSEVPPMPEYSFFSWVGGYLWYLFPIVKSKREEKVTWGTAFKEAAHEIGCGVLKSLFFPLALRYLNYTTTTGRELAENTAKSAGNVVVRGLVRYIQSCKECFAFGVVVGVIALPFNNYIGGLIRLFTKGKYEHLPFCDNVLASGSLRETWGKRYNRWVNYWMKEVCFDPMRRAGYSASAGSLACFSLSGVLHMYVSYHTFSKCPITGIRSFTFFFLHGLLCAYEPAILSSLTSLAKAILPSSTSTSSSSSSSSSSCLVERGVGKLWVGGAFFLTFPLYLGLFKFPQYAIQNPFPVSQFERVWDYLLPATSAYKY